MRIVFHGVSIFELITREKKGREKKKEKRNFEEKGKRKITEWTTRIHGFWTIVDAMFLMDVQFQNSDT